jgi:hypothetical protein
MSSIYLPNQINDVNVKRNKSRGLVFGFALTQKVNV